MQSFTGLQHHCSVSTPLSSETKCAAARHPHCKITCFAESFSVGNLTGSPVTYKATVQCTNILTAQGSISTIPLYLFCKLILKNFPIVHQTFFPCCHFAVKTPWILLRSIKRLSQPLQRCSTETIIEEVRK